MQKYDGTKCNVFNIREQCKIIKILSIMCFLRSEIIIIINNLII